MSDEAYSSFLDQANQDTYSNKVSAQSKNISTKAVNAEVPTSLKNVDATYTSDADEPFEPVSLTWEEDGLPDEGAFRKLIGHKGEVLKVAAKDFDPQGQYGEVQQAVKQASDGKMAIFRVEHQGTRVEYYVVGLSKGKIVGLKALAVES